MAKRMKSRMEFYLSNPHLKIIVGIQSGDYEQYVKNGKDFYYVDHSYFKRGWEKDNFRLVRSGLHLTRVIPNHQQNRLKKFEVEIHPYKKNRGSKIGFLRTSNYVATLNNLRPREEELIEEIKKHTDREIVYRSKGDGGTVEEFMSQCHAAVALMTVAAVDAAMLGYPVFSTELCPSWPISGKIKDIETPEYPDRYEWANSLAWSSWNRNEIDTIDLERYQT